jgi:hypothetical protein
MTVLAAVLAILFVLTAVVAWGRFDALQLVTIPEAQCPEQYKTRRRRRFRSSAGRQVNHLVQRNHESKERS